MTTMIVFGASRGLGAALCEGLPEKGDVLWLVSRTRPDSVGRHDGVERHWIQADLSNPSSAAHTVAENLAKQRVDVVIYNAGVWEANAFTGGYSFQETVDAETEALIAINLTSAILCTQKMIGNLRRSPHGKIILIGSTSGLENTRTPEVAYNASKFGLRGMAHALREVLRHDKIAVTCINPGSINTTTAYDKGRDAALAASKTEIPVHDLVSLVKCIVGLSNAVCIKEIDMPAMSDLTA